MRYLTSIILLIGILIWPFSAFAQNDDYSDLPINFGQTVSETITESAFYDWWRISLAPGQEIRVVMRGGDGLEPLVGLLNPGLNLIARSPDGTPDETVQFTHTVEEAGEYIIVATRTGNQAGTSIGDYELEVVLNSAPERRANPFREVVFTCNQDEASNALTLAFAEDQDQAEVFRVTAYGLDGFIPVMRTTVRVPTETEDRQFCVAAPFSTNPEVGEGDTLTLPDSEPLVIDENSIRTIYGQPGEPYQLGIVTVNIGSLDGATGRFVVVIEGMQTGPNADRDLIEIGLGPLARETDLRVYQVADSSSRLDPFMERIDDRQITVESCDDAGLRDCDAITPIDGFELITVDPENTIRANRFDAGLLLSPGTPDPQPLLFGAFGGRTHGPYTVVIIGELPPRDTAD